MKKKSEYIIPRLQVISIPVPEDVLYFTSVPGGDPDDGTLPVDAKPNAFFDEDEEEEEVDAGLFIIKKNYNVWEDD